MRIILSADAFEKPIFPNREPWHPGELTAACLKSTADPFQAAFVAVLSQR